MTTTAPAPQSRANRSAKPSPAPEPAPKPVRGRRKPARFALALALIVLGTLATVWYVNTISQTTQVVAVAAPLERGTVIGQDDLTVVDLPDGPTVLATVPAADIEQMVGRYANVDLPAGSTLTPESVVDELNPAEGKSIVGVALSPAQMPIEALRAGDTVRIVETPVNQGDPPVEEPGTIDAVVISTTAPGANATGDDVIVTSDQTIVDVEVDTSEAAALAARAATGRVALVIDSMES